MSSLTGVGGGSISLGMTPLGGGYAAPQGNPYHPYATSGNQLVIGENYSGGHAAAPMPTFAPQPSYVNAVQSPLTVNASRDANLEQTYQDSRNFQQKLSAGMDQDAVNAMMRQRDAISGSAKEVGEARALATGGTGSGAAQQAVTDVYTSGGRDLSGLNASLAAGGRSAQLAALGGQAAVAGGGAAALNANNNFALATWQASRNAAEADAAAKNAAARANWESSMQLAALFTG